MSGSIVDWDDEMTSKLTHHEAPARDFLLTEGGREGVSLLPIPAAIAFLPFTIDYFTTHHCPLTIHHSPYKFDIENSIFEIFH